MDNKMVVSHLSLCRAVFIWKFYGFTFANFKCVQENAHTAGTALKRVLYGSLSNKSFSLQYQQIAKLNWKVHYVLMMYKNTHWHIYAAIFVVTMSQHTNAVLIDNFTYVNSGNAVTHFNTGSTHTDWNCRLTVIATVQTSFTMFTSCKVTMSANV